MDSSRLSAILFLLLCSLPPVPIADLKSCCLSRPSARSYHLCSTQTSTRPAPSASGNKRHAHSSSRTAFVTQAVQQQACRPSCSSCCRLRDPCPRLLFAATGGRRWRCSSLCMQQAQGRRIVEKVRCTRFSCSPARGFCRCPPDELI